MQITLTMLKSKHACPVQCSEFEKRFGDSIEVTPALCLSVASVFDWKWAAEHLLSPPARKAYYEAKAPAWKAYNEAIAPALKIYNEAKASAFANAFLNL